MLSDTDIKRLLDREIIIHPFYEQSLTPLGYDLRVGGLIYCLETGLLEPDANGVFHIPPKSTVLVLTEEMIWLSARIAGTLHPRVWLTWHNLSHISTTVDPCWDGPLLISIRNHGDEVFSIKQGGRLCTLVLHRLNHRASKFQRDRALLHEILAKYSKGDAGKQLADRLQELIKDDNVAQEFRSRIREASAPFMERLKTVEGRQRILVLRDRWLNWMSWTAVTGSIIGFPIAAIVGLIDWGSASAGIVAILVFADNISRREK